jgi:hypothetical protein
VSINLAWSPTATGLSLYNSPNAFLSGATGRAGDNKTGIYLAQGSDYAVLDGWSINRSVSHEDAAGIRVYAEGVTIVDPVFNTTGQANLCDIATLVGLSEPPVVTGAQTRFDEVTYCTERGAEAARVTGEVEAPRVDLPTALLAEHVTDVASFIETIQQLVMRDVGDTQMTREGVRLLVGEAFELTGEGAADAVPEALVDALFGLVSSTR